MVNRLLTSRDSVGGSVSSHFHVEQTLKYLETILNEMPNFAGQRRGPALRDRASIDLDEDLFSPAGGAPAAANVRPSRAAPAADLDDRPWPMLEALPKAGPSSAIEKRVAEQERELAMRCTQVADLYNLQERQAADLDVAYAEIERLNKAFAELQDTATQHAMAAAERKKAVTALHQDNAILRSRLDKALDDAAALAKQMLTVETMFNDRELVVTSALEKADLLKAELAAAGEEKARLIAEIEATEQLRQDDSQHQRTIVEELNRKVESLFADNGVQMKTREKLAKRCDELAKTVAALEADNADTHSKLNAHGEHTTFLETVLRVERETAEAKIRELTEKLEQERQLNAAGGEATNAMRQEMAALLREITARRRPAVVSAEPAAPAPQWDAA